MPNVMLPAPDGANDQNSADNSTSNQAGAQYTRRSSQRKGAGIPDRETCLRALGQMPGLIALGYLKTSDANSMARIYATILQNLNPKQQSDGNGQGIPEAILEAMVRQNPELLNLWEDLLTDEQIDAVMQKVKEDDSGQS